VDFLRNKVNRRTATIDAVFVPSAGTGSEAINEHGYPIRIEESFTRERKLLQQRCAQLSSRAFCKAPRRREKPAVLSSRIVGQGSETSANGRVGTAFA
jgi:hypothetical protein